MTSESHRNTGDWRAVVIDMPNSSSNRCNRYLTRHPTQVPRPPGLHLDLAGLLDNAASPGNADRRTEIANDWCKDSHLRFNPYAPLWYQQPWYASPKAHSTFAPRELLPHAGKLEDMAKRHIDSGRTFVSTSFRYQGLYRIFV